MSGVCVRAGFWCQSVLSGRNDLHVACSGRVYFMMAMDDADRGKGVQWLVRIISTRLLTKTMKLDLSPAALLLLLSISAHVLLCPYAKVEESFNLQAVHDVLRYGADLARVGSAGSWGSGRVERPSTGLLLAPAAAWPLLNSFIATAPQRQRSSRVSGGDRHAILRYCATAARIWPELSNRWLCVDHTAIYCSA